MSKPQPIPNAYRLGDLPVGSKVIIHGEIKTIAKQGMSVGVHESTVQFVPTCIAELVSLPEPKKVPLLEIPEGGKFQRPDFPGKIYTKGYAAYQCRCVADNEKGFINATELVVPVEEES